MGSGGRLARSIFFNFATRALVLPAAFGLQLALSRLFGAVIVGQLALLLFFVGLTGYLSRLAAGSGLIHALSAHGEDSAGGWRSLWKAGLYSLPIMLGGGCIIAVGGVIALDRAYGQRELWTPFLAVLAASVVFEHGWQLAQCRFRATQRMQFYLAAETLSQYLSLVFLLAAPWLLGRTVLSAALQKAVYLLIAFSLSAVLVVREFRRRSRADHAGPTPYRKVLGFNIRAFPQQVSDLLIEYADRLVIPLFLPMASLGYYASAYAAFKAFDTLTRIPCQMLFPALSKLDQEKKPEEFWRVYASTQKYVVGFGWPLILLGIGVSDVIMGWFGPEFRQAASTLMILLVGAIFASLAHLSGNLLSAKNRLREASQSAAVSAVVNAGLNLLLVPFWGLPGAAAASTLGYLTMAVLNIRFAVQATGRSAWDMIQPALAAKILGAGSVLLILPLVWTEGAPPITRAAVTLGALAAFSGAVLLLRVWKPRDFEAIRNAVKSSSTPPPP